VDQRQTVASLLAKAHRYRDLARWVGDRETMQRISAFSEELKQQARALAKPNEDLIRKRAREIWEENGCPAGRDEEFWFQGRNVSFGKLRNWQMNLPTMFKAGHSVGVFHDRPGRGANR
jgi:uncharacterized membrane protein YccC